MNSMRRHVKCFLTVRKLRGKKLKCIFDDWATIIIKKKAPDKG